MHSPDSTSTKEAHGIENIKKMNVLKKIQFIQNGQRKISNISRCRTKLMSVNCKSLMQTDTLYYRIESENKSS